MHALKVPKWRQQGRENTRYQVRMRDKFTCQSCKKKWRKGRQFDVHHLNGDCGKLAHKYDPISLMHTMLTLCHSCHYKHHQFKGNLYRGGSSGILRFDRAKARKLRSRGYTYDEIGERLGVSQSAVCRAIVGTA